MVRRITMTTIDTRTKISAYSTIPWPCCFMLGPGYAKSLQSPPFLAGCRRSFSYGLWPLFDGVGRTRPGGLSWALPGGVGFVLSGGPGVWPCPGVGVARCPELTVLPFCDANE